MSVSSGSAATVLRPHLSVNEDKFYEYELRSVYVSRSRYACARPPALAIPCSLRTLLGDDVFRTELCSPAPIQKVKVKIIEIRVWLIRCACFDGKLLSLSPRQRD